MFGSPMSFGGEEFFRAPPEKIYALVTDPQSLVQTIPDLASHEILPDGTLKCVVTPGFSFVRGRMEVTMSVTEKAPPRSAAMRATSSGIGMQFTVASKLNLAPHEGGTKLIWEAQVVEMKGLVATLSGGLIRAAAEQVIQQTWAGLRKQAESP